MSVSATTYVLGETKPHTLSLFLCIRFREVILIFSIPRYSVCEDEKFIFASYVNIKTGKYAKLSEGLVT